MPGPLVVGAEGVILQPEDAYASSRPIMEGLELLMMLEKFPTSMVSILCNTTQQTEAEYFVKINGFPNAAVVTAVPEDKDMSPADAQWHAINRIRSKGPINLVLTAHREVYTHCIHSHQAALLFGRKGALSTMEESPTWNDLHERVKANREARLDETDRSESEPGAAAIPFRGV